MKDPTARAHSPRRRFQAAVAASIGFHLTLLAVPVAVWRAMPHAPGPGVDRDAGRRSSDFLVVSLMDAPGSAGEPAPAQARVEDPTPSPGVPPAAAAAAAAADLPAIDPSSRGIATVDGEAAGASGLGGNADGSGGGGQPGGVGEGGGVGGTSMRYQPPRLLAGALPLTPQESESLPSPLEIPVRLRIGRDGSVTAVEPADPALSAGLRDALERSARTMRFVPARLGAEPVEAWFAMTFIYRR